MRSSQVVLYTCEDLFLVLYFPLNPKIIILMRKILLSFLFVLSSSAIVAQEIKVQSMELLQSDLSARTNPRLDGNDEPCAMIKVIVPAVEGDAV